MKIYNRQDIIKGNHDTLYCSECGMTISSVATEWRIHNQTNTEEKYPVSDCCFADLCDHETSVYVRLGLIKRRQEERDKRSRELVREIFGLDYRKLIIARTA